MKHHGSMNRVYRLVWSRVKNAWVVVAETTGGRGKKAPRKIASAVLLLSAAWVQAAPSGGQVVSGAGSISQNGDTTTIQQSSQQLSLTWKGFDIAPQEAVNFEQPSAAAIAVNRIYDTNGTQILGRLNANGQVYLINPNGILFGQGAQVNVGGLVASALDINDASLGSNTRNFSGNGEGGITNRGNLHAADGGYIALLGRTVSNQGVISAKLGTVALGAGSAATLTFDGNSLVNMQVDQSTLDNLAENRQLIRADGGRVLMTAGAKDSLLASVVNNTGIIEARTVENHDGVITLLGGMQAGAVNVGGALDAGAPDGGDGGFIETSAARVAVADDAVVSTLAPQGNNGTWLIDPTDFTIAASGGDMTGAAVGAALAGGNVIIQSAAGAADANGDINVNDSVSWNANTLTLNASNDIVINSEMNGSGTAGLALEYGQASAFGNTAEYVVNAPVNLAGTGSFSTKLGSDGATVDYAIITDLGAEGSTSAADLQGINGDLEGSYVLGENIDAADTVNWNGGEGFAPIGKEGTPFSGIFDGLGHTISGLTINLPTTDNVGLVGYTAGASIRNVGLVGGSVSGQDNVGGLVGVNGSMVSNSFAMTSVSGSSNVGGLIGFNDGEGLLAVSDDGTVSNSYATGSVNGNSIVGGLVGSNDGKISNSYASGSVNGQDFVGGLLGINEGSGFLSFRDGGLVSNSYATGSVSGQNYVGGLVGGNDGTVSNSFATGNLSGNDYIGGLAGFNYHFGSIRDSYAIGTVSGQDYVGGLAGGNDGVVSNSYATGDENGNDFIGGLAGFNYYSASISDSYAVGSVSGSRNVGGLVGGNDGAVRNSFATGGVSGISNIGGLIGGSDGAVSDSYAAGDVSGYDFVGGLVGLNDDDGLFGSIDGGAITNSYAIGSVIGQEYVGGLVGGNDGAVSGSYATGSVSGYDYVGGLVGGNDGWVTNSYAMGGVYGISNVGGLVGRGKGDRVSISEFSSSDIFDRLVEANLTISTSVNNSFFTNSPINSNFSSVFISSGNSFFSSNLIIISPPPFDNDFSPNVPNGSSFDGGLQGGSDVGIVGNSYATGSVSGGSYVGGLAGALDGGSVSNSYATGGVYGQDNSGGLVGWLDGGSVSNSYAVGSVNGQDYTGGLVGRFNDGTISNSYAKGNVNGQDYSGGLVGFSEFSLISDSYATGRVNGQNYAGGLVGAFNREAIRNSYATGSVSGQDYAGGLVGFNDFFSLIDDSYAKGDVSGNSYVGGLVGGNGVFSLVSNSYATGSVYGSSYVGGLVGFNNHSGIISDSYAAGSVSGVYSVGGLVGLNDGFGPFEFFNEGSGAFVSPNDGRLVFQFLLFHDGVVSNSYAVGSVTGNIGVGGLVGSNDGVISNSYAVGSVSGDSNVGGLVGVNEFGAVENSYWDTETSGQTSSAGGAGITTAQMQTLSTFTGWDFENTWIIYENHTAPLLRVFMTPLTVTAHDFAKTYDGLAYFGGNGVTYSSAPDARLLGSLNYSGTSQGAANAGSYAITPDGLYSNQQGYAIDFVSGELTIDPRIVNLSGSRVYDGSADVAADIFSLGNLAAGETLSLSGSGSVAGKDVGTQSVSLGTLALENGSGLASNYTLAGGAYTALITPATLTYTAKPSVQVAGLALPGLTGSIVGFVGSDTLANATSGEAIWTTTANIDSLPGSYNITGAGLSAQNYVFSNAPDNESALMLVSQFPLEPVASVISPEALQDPDPFTQSPDPDNLNVNGAYFSGTGGNSSQLLTIEGGGVNLPE